MAAGVGADGRGAPAFLSNRGIEGGWGRLVAPGRGVAGAGEPRTAGVQAVARLVRLPIIPGAGSVLIRREGVVLGAVGVSGGKPEQDVDCAEYGLKAVER